MKPNTRRYLTATAAGLAISLFFASINGVFTEEKVSAIFVILSNSFFASGVLLAGIGVILFVSSEGLFDMLGFGVKTFFQARKRDVKDRKYKDFYEYKKAKSDERRESKTSNAYLLIVGAAFIAVAALCLIGY